MLSDLRSAGSWFVAHPMVVWVVIVAAILAGLYVLVAASSGPRDRSSNGIVVGRAKQFDNRSLNLILEELNASLQKLSALSQSIAERPDVVQESESTDWSRSLSFGFARSGKGAKAGDGIKDGEASTGENGKPEGLSKASGEGASSGAAKSNEKTGAEAPKFSPAYGMAAGDLLADQINLAYQITNLRLLNERALSDRLLSDRLKKGGARLQVVLGFQVSINPPSYAKDCVAVTEIELKLKPSGNAAPISVVAMIPQEKTYNAATLSSSGDSMDGSVVCGLLRMGAAAGRRQNAVYLHRDTDTIAFERNPGWDGGPFGSIGRLTDDAAAVFGWEFRPVLGHRSVSPGARWMLAVVSLPLLDDLGPAAPDPPADSSSVLMVRARTYWRRYRRKHQTTSVRLGLWPLPLPGPQSVETPWYDLPILRTADVQESLSPEIDEVSWEDVGGGAAIVLVKGENFFSGTEVTIGGVRHRARDNKLVLKSDRAMEIHTTIGAIAKGDAVLSGRYGASIPLRTSLQARTTEEPKRPTEQLLQKGINIVDEAVRFERAEGKFGCLAIPLVSAAGGEDNKLTPEVFDYTPQPIICADDVVISLPYYFDDPAPAVDPEGSVVVRCYAPTELFDRATTVLFKMPFMSSNWAPTTAMPQDVVTAEGIGDSVLIFSGSRPFAESKSGSSWVAVLDTEYALGDSGPFVRLTTTRLKLTVPPGTLSRYDKVLLRLGEKCYLLDLPRKSGAAAAASLDVGEAPPVLKRGAAAIVDLKGAGLTQVSSVRLDDADVPFQVFGDGSPLRLFLAGRLTRATGKFDLAIQTAEGELAASVYVLGEPPTADAAERI